jgi:hypothetical protein
MYATFWPVSDAVQAKPSRNLEAKAWKRDLTPHAIPVLRLTPCSVCPIPHPRCRIPDHHRRQEPCASSVVFHAEDDATAAQQPRYCPTPDPEKLVHDLTSRVHGSSSAERSLDALRNLADFFSWKYMSIKGTTCGFPRTRPGHGRLLTAVTKFS